jgi:opacity protein-like surface antigen
LVFGIPYSGDIEINIIPVTATGKGIIPLNFGEVYAGIGGGLYFVSGHLDANVSNVLKISSSATDSIWGMHFLGGISFNITDSFFVGVEGKYILTEGTELDDEIYGMKVKYPDFNLNGYTVSALLGFRF